MNKLNWILDEHGFRIVDRQDRYCVLDLGSYGPESTVRYKSMIAHATDLKHADACLNEMRLQADTTLIDGALMNCAIQLLVKCFSPPKQGGRIHLDVSKVFRRYAKSIGENDLTSSFRLFYDSRNTVISHDNKAYLNNMIGIVVDKLTGEAVEVKEIMTDTTYSYKANVDLLKKLISVSLSYVDSQIQENRARVLEWYNNCQPADDLQVLDATGAERYNTW